jgi:type IV secretion system protein VirB1
MACADLAVPATVMSHVARVESDFNPYAIGIVGGRLQRQPKNLAEAVSTARMLEEKGYNFSLGISQVNRHNMVKYGLDSYERAFDICPNVQAGSQILSECYGRSGGDWGKAFSCYYSGNFTTGFRHGYVQKVYASISREVAASDEIKEGRAIPLVPLRDFHLQGGKASLVKSSVQATDLIGSTLVARRGGIESYRSEPGRETEAIASSVESAHITGPAPTPHQASMPQGDAPVLLGAPRPPVSQHTTVSQAPVSELPNHDSALVF